MKNKIMLLVMLLPVCLLAQVGVNTLYPVGSFHVDGASDNTSITPSVAMQLNDFVVNSTAKVGIGTSAPIFSMDIVGESTDAFRSTTHGSAPRFDFRRSQGTAAAPTDIAGAGAILANMRFFGYASSYSQAATIKIETDAVPSATSMPGRIVFETTPATTVTPLERMRINNAGFVGIGATAPASKLHVDAGSIRVSGSTNTNAETGGMMIYDNASGLGGGTAKKVERRTNVANVRSGNTTIFEDEYVIFRVTGGTLAYIELSPKTGHIGRWVFGAITNASQSNVNATTVGNWYTVSWDFRYSYQTDCWVISKRATTNTPLYKITLQKNSLNDTSEQAIFIIEAYYP